MSQFSSGARACEGAVSSPSETARIAFQRGHWDKLSLLRLHSLPIEKAPKVRP